VEEVEEVDVEEGGGREGREERLGEENGGSVGVLEEEGGAESEGGRGFVESAESEVGEAVETGGVLAGSDGSEAGGGVFSVSLLNFCACTRNVYGVR